MVNITFYIRDTNIKFIPYIKSYINNNLNRKYSDNYWLPMKEKTKTLSKLLVGLKD